MEKLNCLTGDDMQSSSDRLSKQYRMVRGSSVHVKSGSFVHVRRWSSVHVTFVWVCHCISVTWFFLLTLLLFFLYIITQLITVWIFSSHLCVGFLFLGLQMIYESSDDLSPWIPASMTLVSPPTPQPNPKWLVPSINVRGWPLYVRIFAWMTRFLCARMTRLQCAQMTRFQCAQMTRGPYGMGHVLKMIFVNTGYSYIYIIIYIYQSY